jgi:hypothetical protein
MSWYSSRETWRFLFLLYLPWIVGLSLAWELAHAPLYTLWREADAAYIAFSILHCTLGDVLIAAASLVLALSLGREGAPAAWRWGRVAFLTALAGVAYTIFSEWMNITLLRSWTYTEAMPTLELAGFEIGLTPVAQWLVLPPLALYLGRRSNALGRAPTRVVR